MRRLFEEYGISLVVIVSGIMAFSAVMGQLFDPDFLYASGLSRRNHESSAVSELISFTPDQICFDVSDLVFEEEPEDFDWHEQVSAYLYSQGTVVDLSDLVFIKGPAPELDGPGRYELTYCLSFEGLYFEKTAYFYVMEYFDESDV